DGHARAPHPAHRGGGAGNRAHLRGEALEVEPRLGPAEHLAEEVSVGGAEEVAEQLLSPLADLAADPRRGDPVAEPGQRAAPGARMGVVRVDEAAVQVEKDRAEPCGRKKAPGSLGGLTGAGCALRTKRQTVRRPETR